jgi:hypothetical protein
MADFVGIVSDLTEFICNERNASYDLAEKQTIKYVQGWIEGQGITPIESDFVSQALDDFLAKYKAKILPSS